jgi:hypothetical protein
MSANPEAERIIARWDWRMIHSPQGAIALRQSGAPDADAQIAALGEQAMEEMKAAHQAARQAPALRVEELEGRVEDIQQQLRSLGVGDETPVFTPRTDMLPRTSTLMALLLTAAIAAAAAFAAGVFLGLSAPSTYAPEIAVVVLAALTGGIAGDALTRTRTHWAIGIAAGVTALGGISAYLVAWVAGLMPERRLLITALFLMTAVIVGVIWATTSFARSPRSNDAHDVATARRMSGLWATRAELRISLAVLEYLDVEWGAGARNVDALAARARAVALERHGEDALAPDSVASALADHSANTGDPYV